MISDLKSVPSADPNDYGKSKNSGIITNLEEADVSKRRQPEDSKTEVPVFI